MQRGIELRGYEVAKWANGHWEVVSTWRPTEFALNQALKACASLNERHPNLAYVVRPVVSFDPNFVPPKVEEVAEANPDQLGFDFSDTVKSDAPSEHPAPSEVAQ